MTRDESRRKLRALVRPFVPAEDVALCGQPLFEDEKRDTLLNPSAVFEVLSVSTEGYDRGAKFAHYRRVESITHYVLVAQDRPRVELYSRQTDNRWLLTELTELREVLRIDDLELKIPLFEIYDKLDIPEDDAQHPGHP